MGDRDGSYRLVVSNIILLLTTNTAVDQRYIDNKQLLLNITLSWTRSQAVARIAVD